MRIRSRVSALALAAVMSVGTVILPAEFSPVVSVSAAAKLDAPTGLEYTSGKDSITLTWDEVDGAEAYRIYKYNASKKKYEKYKTVSGTACTADGLKSGSTYHFRVASLDKKGSSYTEGGHDDIAVKLSGSTKTKTTSDSKTTEKKTTNKTRIPKFPNLRGFGYDSATKNGITNIVYTSTKEGEYYEKSYIAPKHINDDPNPNSQRWYVDSKRSYNASKTDLKYSLERWLDDKIDDLKDYINDLSYSGYDIKESGSKSSKTQEEISYELYYDDKHVANIKFVASTYHSGKMGGVNKESIYKNDILYEAEHYYYGDGRKVQVIISYNSDKYILS